LISRKESWKTVERKYERWDEIEENKMKDAIYRRVEMEQINEHHLCIQVCPLSVKSGLQDKKENIEHMNKSNKPSTSKKEELKTEKEERDN
jgi:hypothetical protein